MLCEIRGCDYNDFGECVSEAIEDCPYTKAIKEIKLLKKDMSLLITGIMGDDVDLSEKDRKRLDEIYPD